MPEYPITENAPSDKGKIIGGLVVFVLLVMAATFYNLGMGKATTKPQLVYPKGQTQCVKGKRFMRENHMKLLDEWRNSVVRDGKRTQIKVGGRMYQKSLTKTCMHCHTNKATFCDRCHEYAGVTKKGGQLRCWDCHIDPNVKARR